MPIRINADLPAKKILEHENIFVMDYERSLKQDIRLDKEELAVAEWIERDKIDQAQDSYDDLSLTNEMICYFRDHKDV